LGKVLTQLEAAKTRIKNLKAIADRYADRTGRGHGYLVLPNKELYRHMLQVLHPQRAPEGMFKTWERHMAIFTALKAVDTDGNLLNQRPQPLTK
jgi:hypothetical protein